MLPSRSTPTSGRPRDRGEDAIRTAWLAAGELDQAPRLPRAPRTALSPPIPSRPLRLAQTAASKLCEDGVGRLSLAPAVWARRRALGPRAKAPPRFLVRVDEFPNATAYDHPERYGAEPSSRFHARFVNAGVPYLMALVPQLTHRPLDPDATGGRALGPDEIELIEQMAADGVTFAAHGLSHRTRDPRPRHHSELIGLSRGALAALIDESLATLGALNVAPRVFVAPFNRFTADQYAALASRFDVIGGGPESIRHMGLHPTPRWLADAVYVPSHPPLYGTARRVLPEVERLIAARPGTWVPITLHLGWELDEGLDALDRLLARIAPFTAPWTGLLAAIDRIRARRCATLGSAGGPSSTTADGAATGQPDVMADDVRAAG